MTIGEADWVNILLFSIHPVYGKLFKHVRKITQKSIARFLSSRRSFYSPLCLSVRRKKLRGLTVRCSNYVVLR